MLDTAKLEASVRKEIEKIHKLGEHAGESGHLAFRDLSKLTLSTPKEIKWKGRKAYEVICSYAITTESEFWDSDDDSHAESYEDKVIFDEDSKLLNYTPQK